MATSTRTKSNAPSSRFCSYSTSNAPFHSPSSTFFNEHPSHNRTHHRSTSPTRVNFLNPSISSAVRFSLDRSISPNRAVSSHVIANNRRRISIQKKKTCMCSPTTHPGSFRCSLHKSHGGSHHESGSSPSNRLNMRRSAMKNSLVRIGGVEGEWVKRALTALIRPSSHQQRRRTAFEPRPSRLSTMSKAEEENL
ncbi:hypothetical protein RJT34_09229 [Clitoria ternatea]|uniref:Serine-rich protein-like protein n=1 Tax=Clitoria ternatea TaxID=43366 RepID=A0AAN9PUI3_CLITE